MDAMPFEDARARLASAIGARPPRRLAVEGLRPASVLVPVLARPGGASLLFTRRTQLVPRHKGEISFPGGAREPGEDAVEAALREAHEEVGLPPDRVEVLGAIDDLPSITGFVVTPVIGVVAAPPASFVPQAFEVLEPFEIPLARLLAPGVRRAEWWPAARLPPEVEAPLRAARTHVEDYDEAGGRYRVWFFDAAPDRVVWGLTGRILASVLDRAFGAAAVTPG